MSTKPHSGNIELYIDQLVLHGFPRGDRHRIGEAIQQELLRQLFEQGIPDTLARQDHVSRLNAGSVQAEQGGGPERIGMQVAQAVYDSVTGHELRGNGDRSLSPGQTSSTNHSAQIKR
jgi:hypothetical protein